MRKVFLDENVDPKLKAYLSEFRVSSVHEEGWNSVKNGELLQLIQSHFDLLISHDRGLEFQQDWRNRDLALIVLRTPSNRLSTYEASVEQLIEMIRRIQTGQVIRFEI